MEIGSFIAIAVLIFFVAALYSSVGHGGASGYLAVLSLFAVPPAVMSSTALMLNILVAGVALFAYLRAGHLSFKLAWPFVVLSIPAAYLGGLIHVSEKTYYLLLASALVFAAYRLALSAARADIKETERSVKLAISLPVGASIGFLSGIVGIGGGIFLSPVMILFRWADAKKTSAVAALFIVVNSLAGLAGRLQKGEVSVDGFVPLIAVAFAGGVLGSYFGANRFSGIVLRRLLALVLMVAAVKMLGTLL